MVVLIVMSAEMSYIWVEIETALGQPFEWIQDFDQAWSQALQRMG